MRVYVGQTRSRALIAELSTHGFGECTQPTELPPRRRPWFYDNGAFKAWRSGQPFDLARWRAGLDVARSADFVVAPDIVSGGLDSLAFSLSLVDEIQAPAYLVVQDGMTVEAVSKVSDRFAGLFVGGSIDWKLKTGAEWCAFARQLGKPCHIGRVGTARRIRWAFDCGADSIDSCLPLWSKDNLRIFLREVRSSSCQLQLYP